STGDSTAGFLMTCDLLFNHSTSRRRAPIFAEARRNFEPDFWHRNTVRSPMRLLSLIAGSPPARYAANAGLRLSSEHRIRSLERDDPVARQRTQLLNLLNHARHTRFGIDHRFASIGSVEEFQKAVPLRIYED